MGLPARALLLSATDRRLLVEAGLAVVAVRIALWILPYRQVQRWGERLSPVDQSENDPDAVASLSRATRRVSRRVPAASCLTQAIATRILLARRGLSSQLCIGVARSPSGMPQAHAWLEREGRVVIGGIPDLARFSRLPVQRGKVS